MGHFVMMRIKPARTVVRSAIANMTVLSNAISLPISSVVSAVMLVTWVGIAQIGRVVLIGGTGRHLREDSPVAQELQPGGLVLAMLLTASTR
jgi:hypothetical protein